MWVSRGLRPLAGSADAQARAARALALPGTGVTSFAQPRGNRRRARPRDAHRRGRGNSIPLKPSFPERGAERVRRRGPDVEIPSVAGGARGGRAAGRRPWRGRVVDAGAGRRQPAFAHAEMGAVGGAPGRAGAGASRASRRLDRPLQGRREHAPGGEMGARVGERGRQQTCRARQQHLARRRRRTWRRSGAAPRRIPSPRGAG